MLPKQARLPVQHFIRRPGKVFRGQFFLLKVFPAGKERNRFGIALGKNVSKSAVGRNCLKRFLFRALLAHLDREPYLDGILVVLPRASTAKENDLQEELHSLLSSAYRVRR